MGNSSSQMQASTQAQGSTPPPVDANASPQRVEDSQPVVEDAQQDVGSADEVSTTKKRKGGREEGGQAKKKPKKSRASLGAQWLAQSNAEFGKDRIKQQEAGEAVSQPTATEGKRKRKTKRKSEEQAAGGADQVDTEIVAQTQDAPEPDTLANATQTTAVTNTQSTPPQGAKAKRKRPHGRPSGLNLVPAKTPEPTAEIEDAVAGDAEEIPETQVAIAEPEKPTPVASPKPKKSKKRACDSPDDFQFKRKSNGDAVKRSQNENNGEARRASIIGADGAQMNETGRPGPKNRKKQKAAMQKQQDETVPDSQEQQAAAQSEAKKSRKKKAKAALVGTLVTDIKESDDEMEDDKDVEPETVNRRSTAAKRRPKSALVDEQIRREQEQSLGPALPTPPVGTQDRAGNLPTPSEQAFDEVPNSPPKNQGSGGMREDYSAVDATNQVTDWLVDAPNGIPSDWEPSTERKKKRRGWAGQASGKGAEKSREKIQRKQEPEPEPEPRAEDNEMETAKAARKEARWQRRAARRAEAEQERDEDSDYEAPDEGSEPEPEHPAEEPRRKSTKSKSAKATKVTQPETQGPNGNTPDDKPSARPSQTPKQPVPKSAKPTDPHVVKGLFTDAEKAGIDTVYQRFLRESSLSEPAFRASLDKWRDVPEFRNAVYEALPNRPKVAVRKFCQRRYHHLERGPWSPEEDESLRNAYVSHPDRWTEVSALVGRIPGDCKDRWRNVVSLENTMNLGPWSQEEEAKLSRVVEECIDKLKEEHAADINLVPDRASLEHALSWVVVADNFGGTRSAKRCNEKWHKLKRRGITNPNPGTSTATAAPNPITDSKKLRAIEQKYKQCSEGDLYDILTEIHTAVPDVRTCYKDESTLWSTIALHNKNSRFNSAMRRRGFHDALERFGTDIQEGWTIARIAEKVAKGLEHSFGAEGLAERRTYWPKARRDKTVIKVEDGEAGVWSEGKLPAKKKGGVGGPKVFKSAERIEESDGEDEDEDGPLDYDKMDVDHESDKNEQGPDDYDEDEEGGDIVVANSQPTPRARKPARKSQEDDSDSNDNETFPEDSGSASESENEGENAEQVSTPSIHSNAAPLKNLSPEEFAQRCRNGPPSRGPKPGGSARVGRGLKKRGGAWRA